MTAVEAEIAAVEVEPRDPVEWEYAHQEEAAAPAAALGLE